MNAPSHTFQFGAFETRAVVTETIPGPEVVAGFPRALLVCDCNTEYVARRIAAASVAASSSADGVGDGESGPAICILPPGETAKNWRSVETVLNAAYAAGLGRDGLFVGCGGGVISDITGFAASVYMRGAGLCLVSTTLLGMVDAALGGKTGFDLFGIKNCAGTFYPAARVFAPLEVLASLPEREWKSGMAEVLKTAILEESGELFALLQRGAGGVFGVAPTGAAPVGAKTMDTAAVAELIRRAMEIKGRIVAEDPRETGSRRALLNLGHTFGHALEAAAGLGNLTHGEAVAWGLARAAELGRARGVTPEKRADAIRELLARAGYEIRAPHPLLTDPGAFMAALGGDKKKKAGKSIFIVPAARGAERAPVDITETGERKSIERIVFGT
jgi:3-dehydroquinate synthase